MPTQNIEEVFAVVSWPDEDDGSAVSLLTPRHRVCGPLHVGEICKVTEGIKQYNTLVQATGLSVDVYNFTTV